MASGRITKEIIQALSQRLSSSNGFDRVLNKVKLVTAGQGRCKAELKVEPEHQNMNGTLHGGMTATMVDIISTLALMTEGTGAPGVTVDLHVTYMKAAKEGEEVVIDASTLKIGKTMAYLNVDILNKVTGELIAKGSHTKFIGTK